MKCIPAFHAAALRYRKMQFSLDRNQYKVYSKLSLSLVALGSFHLFFPFLDYLKLNYDLPSCLLS